LNAQQWLIREEFLKLFKIIWRIEDSAYLCARFEKQVKLFRQHQHQSKKIAEKKISKIFFEKFARLKLNVTFAVPYKKMLR